MQPGDIVTIYQDPVTQCNPEGQAKLVRLLMSDNGDGMSRWVVRFQGDDQCYTRLVYRQPQFSELELRAICEEEVEVADDFDGYSPRLLVEHIAHCYHLPDALDEAHPIWAIAREVCERAEANNPAYNREAWDTSDEPAPVNWADVHAIAQGISP